MKQLRDNMKLRVLWWNNLNAAPQSSILSQRRGRGASQSGFTHIQNVSDQLRTTEEFNVPVCTLELKIQIEESTKIPKCEGIYITLYYNCIHVT